MMKKILLVIMGWGLSYVATADYEINDDLILSGVSDGTAPAYDCSAGVLLPINMSPTPENPSYFDTSGLATLPAGENVISVTPKGPVVNDPVTGEPSREYDCESPIANMCVGIDCFNGESFGQDTLKLKENNLRIRLVNTAFGNSFGQSWNLEANSSRNGGVSYFSFQTKSVDKNYTRLVQALDGEVPEYDCSVSGTIEDPPPPVGILEVGDEYIVPVLKNGTADCDTSTPYPYVCTWTCETSIDYQVENALVFGVTNSSAQLNGAVSVGSGSEIEAGTVTVGKAALLRRVVNLAEAINESDIINLNKLNDYSVVADEAIVLADLRQQVEDMHREIDSINAEIDLIIEVDDDGDGYSDQDEITCGSDPLDPTSIPVDTDSDGLCDNGVDDDDDGDGVSDSDDPFPLDSTESEDTDGDGIGNEADTDDDNDGINDSEEGSYDADGDGLSNDVDTDSDNDGVSDKDECPNGSPCPDSDGDGTPDFLDAVDNSGGGSWNWWGLLLLTLFTIARRTKY